MEIQNYTLREIITNFYQAVYPNSPNKVSVDYKKDFKEEMIRIIDEAIQQKPVYFKPLTPKEKLSLIAAKVRENIAPFQDRDSDKVRVAENDDFCMNAPIGHLSFIKVEGNSEALTAEQVYNVLYSYFVDGDTLLTYFYKEGYNYSFNQYDGSVSPEMAFKVNDDVIEIYAYYEFLGK